MATKCVICNRVDATSVNNEYGKPLCRQHKNQYERYGRFFKWDIRIQNEYIESENHYEIVLRNINMDEVGRAIIDKDDFDKIIKHKWHFNGGYAKTKINKKCVLLHHMIIKPDNEMYVDHINRNRLDNRKENLRLVNRTINGFNKGKQSNNTSGFVGVSWDASRNKWETHIKKNGKKKHLGRYTDIKDAVNARREAELEYYGEYRNPEYDKHTVFTKEEPTT